jgi:hypothetical protein
MSTNAQRIKIASFAFMIKLSCDTACDAADAMDKQRRPPFK